MYVHFYSAIAKYEQMIIVSKFLAEPFLNDEIKAVHKIYHEVCLR